MRRLQRAVYCSQCGAKLDAAPVDARGAATSDAGSEPDEQVLWSGGYGWRAGYREWLVLLLFAIGVATAHFYDPQRITLLRFILATAIAGLLTMALVGYRTLDARYTLTDQRLIHRNGFIFWKTDRIELIDVDDLRFEDNIFERILDVGNIHVVSSDRSHPRLVMRGIPHAAQVYDLIETARRDERQRRGLFVEAI